LDRLLGFSPLPANGAAEQPVPQPIQRPAGGQYDNTRHRESGLKRKDTRRHAEQADHVERRQQWISPARNLQVGSEIHKRQAKRLHRTAARRRKDGLHRFSRKIVDRYQSIVVGDVSSTKLVKTRMAKSVTQGSRA
jgi:transposase